MLSIEGGCLREWTLGASSKDSSKFYDLDLKLFGLIINSFAKVYLIEQKFFRQYIGMIAGMHCFLIKAFNLVPPIRLQEQT